MLQRGARQAGSVRGGSRGRGEERIPVGSMWERDTSHLSGQQCVRTAAPPRARPTPRRGRVCVSYSRIPYCVGPVRAPSPTVRALLKQETIRYFAAREGGPARQWSSLYYRAPRGKPAGWGKTQAPFNARVATQVYYYI